MTAPAADLVRYHAAQLAKAHRAFVRWHAYVDRICAPAAAAVQVLPAGTPTSEWTAVYSAAQEKARAAAGKAPAMPSKNRKHQMYSDAYWVSLYVRGAGAARPQNLDGIADLLAEAKAAGLL